MCINRWCSEQPEKTPSKLTTLARVDQTEVDIFCSDHDSKQTQREYSIVADVFQKWCTLSAILCVSLCKYCACFGKSAFSNIAAERRILPHFPAPEDVDWHVRIQIPKH